MHDSHLCFAIGSFCTVKPQIPVFLLFICLNKFHIIIAQDCLYSSFNFPPCSMSLIVLHPRWRLQGLTKSVSLPPAAAMAFFNKWNLKLVHHAQHLKYSAALLLSANISVTVAGKITAVEFVLPSVYPIPFFGS